MIKSDSLYFHLNNMVRNTPVNHLSFFNTLAVATFNPNNTDYSNLQKLISHICKKPMRVIETLPNDNTPEGTMYLLYTRP